MSMKELDPSDSDHDRGEDVNVPALQVHEILMRMNDDELAQAGDSESETSEGSWESDDD